MVGIMTRQEEQTKELYTKHNDSQSRQMNRNILIHSLIEKKNENCHQAVTDFFKRDMKISKQIQIKVVHRIGKGTDRPMVVKLKFPNDKGIVFQHIANLKQAKHPKKKSYFVSEQLPEEYAERKRQQNYIKQANKKVPNDEQLELSFKRGQLLVADKPYSPEIAPTYNKAVVNAYNTRDRNYS